MILLVISLGLKVLIKDWNICGESSLTYQRLGSLWHQYYLVPIKDNRLCGRIFLRLINLDRDVLTYQFWIGL